MAETPTREEVYRALKKRHGAELQQKFSQASVAVCGLGGLGSNIAIALARAGVGRLHLIDFDRVDLTNINRQQYTMAQLGEYKTDALKETIGAISPYCEVRTSIVKVMECNIMEHFANDHIICEAFDAAEEKAMLVNGILEHYPEKYLVSASGMAGMASANTIQTRRVTKKFYLCGDETSDISDGIGLVSARVMVCAAHQAHMVLRILAGEYEP